jgi:enterochelin esterase-like enzyme
MRMRQGGKPPKPLKAFSPQDRVMRSIPHLSRALLACIAAVVLLALSSCGGGGGGSSEGAQLSGSTRELGATSSITGNFYPLRVYLPPASAGPRSSLPIVYALDGDWWFDVLVSNAEAAHAGVIVVAIGYNSNRATDYVPQNRCTANGGGHAAFLQFIRTELIPYVEAEVGGDPQQRILLGHSHGGSFVYYALFAETAGHHPFATYLASDASIGCMPATVNEWEAAYGAANTDLPLKLHVSYSVVGNADNAAFADVIANRHYPHFAMQVQSYNATHTGMIPAAFADAVAFALRR